MGAENQATKPLGREASRRATVIQVPIQRRPAHPQVLGDVPVGVPVGLHPFRIGEPPERKEDGYAHRCGETKLTWTTVGTVAVP